MTSRRGCGSRPSARSPNWAPLPTGSRRGSRRRESAPLRSVLGPFKEVPRLSEADLVVNATDEAFQLDIRLPQTAVQEARVGVTSDRLVVEFDGAHRWLELPPVLRRCRPVAGLRHAGGIVFEFRPDPDVWMSGGAT
jgi:hypothetical protein